MPAGARLVPLRAPAEALARVVAQIESTTADLAARLERFEGCHVLVLATSDIDAVADRLTTAGVGHGGVASVRRAVETPSGTRVETVRVLELGQGTADPPPEGRIGFAAQLDPEIQGSRELTHPNGTSGIADVLLCVAADELDRTEARYRTYLDRSARTADHGRTFDLDDGASLTLVGERELGRLLPGGRPAALPALVGCAVRVEDLATTTSLLEQAGFALRRTADGAVVVPAGAARGVALIFR